MVMRRGIKIIWVRREFLLARNPDRREEPSLKHLQQSISFDEVVVLPP